MSTKRATTDDILAALANLTQMLGTSLGLQAETPKAEAPKAEPKPKPKATGRALTRQTRRAFVAAAAKEGNDFGGVSTSAIAAMCVEDPDLVPKGFRIGSGYLAKFSE